VNRWETHTYGLFIAALVVISRLYETPGDVPVLSSVLLCVVVKIFRMLCSTSKLP